MRMAFKIGRAEKNNDIWMVGFEKLNIFEYLKGVWELLL